MNKTLFFMAIVLTAAIVVLMASGSGILPFAIYGSENAGVIMLSEQISNCNDATEKTCYIDDCKTLLVEDVVWWTPNSVSGNRVVFATSIASNYGATLGNVNDVFVRNVDITVSGQNAYTGQTHSIRITDGSQISLNSWGFNLPRPGDADRWFEATGVIEICENDIEPDPYCGDGTCQSGEEGICEEDCGTPEPYCGDGICQSGEECVADCGMPEPEIPIEIIVVIFVVMMLMLLITYWRLR